MIVQLDLYPIDKERDEHPCYCIVCGNVCQLVEKEFMDSKGRTKGRRYWTVVSSCCDAVVEDEVGEELTAKGDLGRCWDCNRKAKAA